MRGRLAAAFAGGVLALAVAGCGGGAADPSAGSSNAAGSSATTPLQERDSLKIVVATKIKNIDPLVAVDLPEVQVLRLISGTLFNLDYDAQGVSPGLATSGKFSDGDRSFTVTLDKNATFSDGSPVTAADVAATFQRALAFKGNLYIGEFQPIDQVSVVGPTTVKFSFNRPYPAFQTMLSFPEFSILEKSEIQAGGAIPAMPVMAGQYVPQGDVRSNSYALERSDHALGTPPAVKTIDFTVVTDSAGRLTQVRGGQADFATDVGAQALSQDNAGVSTHAEPSMGITQLVFNVNQKPLNDPNVRRAISMALDRDQISQIAWAGAMPPNAGLMSTTSVGANPGDPQPDPDQAKSLLAGTACADGCSLTLLFDPSADWQSNTATIIEQNLKAIGIDVSTQPMESTTLTQRLGEANFQMSLSYFGSYADVPDALPQYCMSAAYGFLSCYSGYDSQEAEAAVRRLVEMTDEAQLKSAYQKVNAIFVKDAPLATLTDYAVVWTVRDDAAGYASIGPSSLISIAPQKG